MKTLILAAGRFDEALRARIDQGKEPRLDVFELQRSLGSADVIDFCDVESSRHPAVQLGRKSLGLSAAVAILGYLRRRDYDAVLTSGEDIGIPFAALLKASSARCSHTMIAHTLAPPKKRRLITGLGLASRFDRVLAYASSEEALMIEQLGFSSDQVERIYYHADEQFFRPDARPLEPQLICAAGQLLRDYDCLIEAVSDLPVELQIAAGSPWIDKRLEPGRKLPANVRWGKLGRFELRDLYARSALAVVPIFENEYQTGIATILEMMAMGKCVIATRTRGQTDTIVDGETGVYVPPGDARALRSAIERLLADPAEAARLGRAARRFVEEQAGLDLFVQRLSRALEAGHARRARVA